MPLIDRLKFKPFEGPSSEIYAQVKLTTPGGTEIDTSGMDSLKMRLQLDAADELTIEMAAQTLDGDWRTDMPVWNTGSTILVHVGYDGDFDFMQSFEIVSTTTRYGEDTGGESMTIRGVSELVKAARNKDPRVFDSDPGDDAAIVTSVADEYGWYADVSSDNWLNLKHRVKEAGSSDLDLLKLIAKQARLGGPRVDQFKTLYMPTPQIGPLKFARGYGDADARRLHSLSMERDGGSQTRVAVIAWNPELQDWVQKEFEVNAFGDEPNLVFEGTRAQRPLPVNPGQDVKTSSLTLAVVDYTGSGKNERIDVLNTAIYDTNDGLTAEELAKRYFELREKLSRWATVVVDGHADLVPYVSITLQGNLAKIDAGVWLPIWCEHVISSNGWQATCRVIRVVEDVNFPVESVE